MIASYSRPNWAQIDLDALRHNARVVAGHVAPARLVAVIKANAYGHGALEVARALQNVSEVAMLSVASVDEAAHLRQNGIETPILLLSAILPEEARDVVRLGLTATVFDLEVAAALNQAAEAQKRRASVHFKIDTGMSRLGAHWCEAARVFESVSRFQNLQIAAIYTHFACADEESDFSVLQLRRFNEFCGEIALPPTALRHAANSAGALRFPEASFDLVRPGLALYGAHPCRELAPNFDLRPVMTWRVRVTALKNVAKGQGVSYGATWTAPRASQIAVLPAGYADGYGRALSNCGEVLLNGKLAPVVGRVTMDQILVDVTEIPTRIGDQATLFGENLPVEAVAARAGTIAYELLCAVSSRVPRVYRREEGGGRWG